MSAVQASVVPVAVSKNNIELEQEGDHHHSFAAGLLP